MSIAAKLVMLLICLVAGFAGGIKYHSGQDAIAEGARLELVRETERGNRATEKQQATKVIGAINESRKREVAAKVAAAGARTELDGLRDELQSRSNNLPSATPDACRKYTSALSEVFGQCAARLKAMAGSAQGHSDDTLTLEQAWPK